uniref:PARP n=2 Tax=Haptolina brevifila TaxID=156173 RepID=A0A7S2J5K0_9EUKA|mmetsp:Transcript_77058/g.152915  ORF Transcript_77058/g.152915 Transcript_77058/m.152915 type:complete len:759 (+) Transcript_77058:381-2657(+)|eukprot:CAMPEP_0174694530 /NCGR_PEP_ID=MMETSP1094-20130205/1096_1 /TAXON_ID=156173 /ORGANISM="Chrysochromulina brevifilum, Strain UTEX LB 985" /LENGTH=758 /DNA_ID=CAMNT_0015890789 /DNA_START=111 /DNA_END=2387 /DNA_ORIENTATION=-
MTWGDVPPLFATNNIFPPDASADAKAENDLRHLFVRFGRTCDANYWPPSNGAKLEGVTELLRRHYKDTYRHLCLQTGTEVRSNTERLAACVGHVLGMEINRGRVRMPQDPSRWSEYKGDTTPQVKGPIPGYELNEQTRIGDREAPIPFDEMVKDMGWVCNRLRQHGASDADLDTIQRAMDSGVCVSIEGIQSALGSDAKFPFIVGIQRGGYDSSAILVDRCFHDEAASLEDRADEFDRGRVLEFHETYGKYKFCSWEGRELLPDSWLEDKEIPEQKTFRPGSQICLPETAAELASAIARLLKGLCDLLGGNGIACDLTGLGELTTLETAGQPVRYEPTASHHPPRINELADAAYSCRRVLLTSPPPPLTPLVPPQPPLPSVPPLPPRLLKLLDPSSREALRVEAKLKDSISDCQQVTVWKVHHHRSLAHYKITLQRHGNEHELWHSPSDTDPLTLLESEYPFDPTFSIGGSYGNGVYFSEHAIYGDRILPCRRSRPKADVASDHELGDLVAEAWEDPAGLSGAMPHAGDEITLGDKPAVYVVQENGQLLEKRWDVRKKSPHQAKSPPKALGNGSDGTILWHSADLRYTILSNVVLGKMQDYGEKFKPSLKREPPGHQSASGTERHLDIAQVNVRKDWSEWQGDFDPLVKHGDVYGRQYCVWRPNMVTPSFLVRYRRKSGLAPPAAAVAHPPPSAPLPPAPPPPAQPTRQSKRGREDAGGSSDWKCVHCSKCNSANEPRCQGTDRHGQPCGYSRDFGII